MTRLMIIAMCLIGVANSEADIVHFKFQGNGGEGILASNEVPPTNGGSGGILTGILLDTDTTELTLDFGWGSEQGFDDLTSDITLLNIHGPTNSSGSAAWNENAGVVTTLSNFDPSFDSGRFEGTITLSSSQVAELLAGRYYMHFHTEELGDGEARGYLTVDSIEVTPDSITVNRGVLVSGDANDLASSDNEDLRVRRSSTDVQSRTQVIVKGTSLIANPTSLEVSLEGSVFARTTVGQTIELFDYSNSNWVEDRFAKCIAIFRYHDNDHGTWKSVAFCRARNSMYGSQIAVSVSECSSAVHFQHRPVFVGCGVSNDKVLRRLQPRASSFR